MWGGIIWWETGDGRRETGEGSGACPAPGTQWDSSGKEGGRGFRPPVIPPCLLEAKGTREAFPDPLRFHPRVPAARDVRCKFPLCHSRWRVNVSQGITRSRGRSAVARGGQGWTRGFRPTHQPVGWRGSC